MRYVVEGFGWTEGPGGGSWPRELPLLHGCIPLVIQPEPGGQTAAWAGAVLNGHGIQQEVLQVYQYPKPKSEPDEVTECIRQMETDMLRNIERATRPPVDTDKFTGPVCRKPAPWIDPIRAPGDAVLGNDRLASPQREFNLEVYRKIAELIAAVNALRQKA
jgi:hypothetical protein